ncbi:MAG: AmmeMemoRadiSam system radical SAM enzyme [Candidatus Paceibacterota bacterium]|jgi:pyruvate formate lyase activating enzyme
MKESYLYEKLENKKVRCNTCAHRCLVMPAAFGICGVRKNIEGVLFALNYGKVISLSVDPIEKKPYFHFLSGSHSLSVATVGCNLRCDNCQNWQISQLVKKDKSMLDVGQDILPEEIVAEAIKSKCPSISYTYTEPTIFLEYALDTMKIAKKKGIKNTWVTNGYMSDETLNLIVPFLDAANVDIKSFDDEFYKKSCGAGVGPILDNCRKMKKLGVWVEITTLVIPTLSDDSAMLGNIAEFIFNELGSDTPWHLSAFSGEISWKLQNLPDTPLKTVQKAYKIGKDAGLKYVYLGNVPGGTTENTYCPKCSELCVKRVGYYIERFDKDGKCPNCQEKLNFIL